MTMKWILVLIQFVLSGCATSPEKTESGYPDGSSLQVKDNVRVVYGVGGDRARQGIGEGLFFAQRLIDGYDATQITPEQRTVVVVLYNNAAYWLLNDEAWLRTTPTGALTGPKNPNTEIVAELLKRGVHIEVCGTTMKKNKWTKEDLIPGVVVVPGAYARLVDLQLQGFAYVAFDQGTP